MDRYAEALARNLPEVSLAPEARTVRGPRYWARYVGYPRALRRHHPSLVHILDHSYGHCLSAFPDARTVVTIHDLWPLHVRRRGDPGLRSRLRDHLLKRSLALVATASHWIAASTAIADEAAADLGLARERITVIPNGVDAKHFSPDPAGSSGRRTAWQQRAACGDVPIVLHVGSCEPRKNVEALVLAAAALRRGGQDCLVVQIGGRFTPAQRALIARVKLEDRVLQEHGVSDEALAEAYRSADLLVLPSTYEGFGLPVLEAMAAGLPVLTSGASGLREAGGDAATVADPADSVDFAGAIGALLADSDRRSQMRAAGLVRASQCTWDRTAAAVRAVYDDVLR
jgi:glycosyltransferase involved in cell wall biosynthesis